MPGTPIGPLRCSRTSATPPGFPVPVQVLQPTRTSATVANLVLPTQFGQQETGLRHSGQKLQSHNFEHVPVTSVTQNFSHTILNMSQHQDTGSTLASGSRLTAFTLNAPSLRCYAVADRDQTTETNQMAEKERVAESDYKLFRQAVWNSVGLFHSSADKADDMDMEAGMLISSEDSHMWQDHMENATFSQGSGTLLCQDCAGSEVIRRVGWYPLCDPPSTQKPKFWFFSPQNVLGREHYRLRMQETAEYLLAPLSLGSATGATPKIMQHRCYCTQKS